MLVGIFIELVDSTVLYILCCALTLTTVKSDGACEWFLNVV